MMSSLMSSPPMSISHRLFNSRDVVASSPSFFRPTPPSRAPWRACRQAISWSKTVSRAKILAISASRRVALKSHIPSRNFSFFRIPHFTSVKPSISRISFQTLGKPAPKRVLKYYSISWKKLSVYFKLINTKSHLKCAVFFVFCFSFDLLLMYRL